MIPYQQRVVDEKHELDDKIERLVAFRSTTVYAALPIDERERLILQLTAMREYSRMLGARIAHFVQ